MSEKGFNVVAVEEGVVTSDEFVHGLHAKLNEVFSCFDCLYDLTHKEFAVFCVSHYCGHGWEAVSQGLKGSLCNLRVRVFGAHKDACQYGFLD